MSRSGKWCQESWKRGKRGSRKRVEGARETRKRWPDLCTIAVYKESDENLR